MHINIYIYIVQLHINLLSFPLHCRLQLAEMSTDSSALVAKAKWTRVARATVAATSATVAATSAEPTSPKHALGDTRMAAERGGFTKRHCPKANW